MKDKLCLDLFSGLGGWSEAFMGRDDWDVVRVDNDPRFEDVPNTIIMDILDIDLREKNINDMLALSIDGLKYTYRQPTIVLASPPCTRMSVASCRWYWGKIDDGKLSPGKSAREHIELFKKARDIIYKTNAHFYVIENPMGMSKHIMGAPDHRTYFCVWKGRDPVTGKLPPMKPTDLWYYLPESIVFPPKVDGTWEKAPRGSRRGTQGIKDVAERAKIPYGLSEFIRENIDSFYDTDHDLIDKIHPVPLRRDVYDFSDVPLPEGKK